MDVLESRSYVFNKLCDLRMVLISYYFNVCLSVLTRNITRTYYLYSNKSLNKNVLKDMYDFGRIGAHCGPYVGLKLWEKREDRLLIWNLNIRKVGSVPFQ